MYAEGQLASSTSGQEQVVIIIAIIKISYSYLYYINSLKQGLQVIKVGRFWETYYNYNRDKQKKKCMHCQDQNCVQNDSKESV